MKMGLLVVLNVGVGWILGVVMMMVFLPLNGTIDYTFMEAMGNTLVFGFPGIIMFMVALILSFVDGSDSGPF
jgi:hypothetical protein